MNRTSPLPLPLPDTRPVRRFTKAIRLPLGPGFAAVLLCVFYSAAIFGPSLVPHDPREQVLSNRLLPPIGFGDEATWSHPLGTDQLGRDQVSRLITGARVTALVVTTAIIASTILGTLAGLLSGYVGRWVDMLLMRFVDIQLSIPALILAIALASTMDPGIKNIFIVLVVWSWAPFARVVRAEVLSQRSRDYVTAARTTGCTDVRIMLRHILPNIIPVISVLATLNVGRFIVFEAGLSFLGLGVQEPSPAWGSMLAAARTLIVDAWWLAVSPGVAILTVSLAGNMLGDYLSDRLDPKKVWKAS
ncbi:MAG: ABC transporter permease [Dehalococcoidia bacterium]|nr:ABC transporter permease [Dehalococcoidia bacterium]